MAEQESAKTMNANMPLADKILRNAIAIDAATIIVQQKLLKLQDCKLIICIALRREIEDIHGSLHPIYEFLIKHPQRDDKREWKSKLLEAIYRMEDGIDIFHSTTAPQDPANVTHTIGFCRPNMFKILWANCSLRTRLQEFKSGIVELKSEQHISLKSTKGSDSKDEEPTRRRVHYPMEWDKYLYADISGDVLKARKNDMEKLENAITVSDLSADKVTVIVGKQGYGKTFLARRIFSQLRDRFQCCAWVNVSRKDEPYDVLCSVVEQVKHKSVLMPNAKGPHMESMGEMLWKALYNKSYFIVMDDVHDLRLLWPVLFSLPNAACGGHLLITTQKNSVAGPFEEEEEEEGKGKGKGEERIVRLKTLDNDDMKALINSKLEIVGRDSKHLLGAAIDKCGGLPLRVNLLGGLIAKSSDHKDELIERVPDNLNDLFAYCYNHMRGELKPCFLYMTLFPKSHAIPVRRLLRLWLSEGLLVVPRNANMEPEDLGLDYLKELMIRNFIEVVQWKEDGSPRRVRVITCLDDLFCSGAIGTELLYIHPHKETDGGQLAGDQHQQGPAVPRIRWLAEHSNVVDLSPDAKINGLRSFLSFDFREGMLTEDIGNFLKTVSGKGSNLVTVLDLEGVYKPNLDKVLGKLVLLKYLGLRSTALGSLPKSVANLPYLETLDLKHTNVTELPKSFWRKSRNLRHLYLNSYCHIDKSILSSSFATSTEALANLRTLSGAVVSSFHVDKDKKTSKETIEGLSNIKKLTKLGIMFRFNDAYQKAIGDWVSGLTNLQSLKLGVIEPSKPSKLPPNLSLEQHYFLSKLYLLGDIQGFWKNLIPQNLTSITFSGSNIEGPELISQLGNLKYLKVLNLLGKSLTEKCLKFNDHHFENLLILRLWKLEDLQELELDTEKALPKIKTIELRKCHKMEEIKPLIQDSETESQDSGTERTVFLKLIDMPVMKIRKETNHLVAEKSKEETDPQVAKKIRESELKHRNIAIVVKTRKRVLYPTSAEDEM